MNKCDLLDELSSSKLVPLRYLEKQHHETAVNERRNEQTDSRALLAVLRALE